ncbi:MAG: hypothetical protein M1831_007232 [Alyxoria varia]|nr:MAG: hypothetical protein M1831_007232 [Alyxoria varia]
MNSEGFQTAQADNVKNIPILPSSSSPSEPAPDDAMDISPSNTTPKGQSNGTPKSRKEGSREGSAQRGSSANATGAAAAVQQPKVVQTAFIHKLYNMLEDQSIQHLISWSSSNESFLISPSTEFSKVLASYFKHTNVSSFVRQLNMYGFHKVSDVFHTGSPDSPFWEFKHGNGSFRRGDLNGLRDIKRRASRHTLIHRDSFPTAPPPKISNPPPAPSQGPAEPMSEPGDARLSMLEHSLYEIHSRLTRSEENNAFMAAKCQDLSEKLSKTYHYNHDLSSTLMKLLDDPEHPVYRDGSSSFPESHTRADDDTNIKIAVASMQQDITRQLDDMRRTSDEFRTPDRRPSLPQQSKADPNMSVSPMSRPFDEGRRASIQTVGRSPAYPRSYGASPQRYGSIGTAEGSGAPAGLAPPPQSGASASNLAAPVNPFQPRAPSPLSMQPPSYLPRRHTSADIRAHLPGGAEQSLPPNQSHPPPPNSHYPDGSSEYNPPPPAAGDTQLQDSLARYSLSSSTQPSSSNPNSATTAPSNYSSGPPSTVQPLKRGSVPQVAQTQAAAHPQSHNNPSPRATPAAPPPSNPESQGWTVPPAIRLPFNKDIFTNSNSKNNGSLKAHSVSGPTGAPAERNMFATGGGFGSNDSSYPSTRRGSLAAISSLLNPAEAPAERDEDEMGGPKSLAPVPGPVAGNGSNRYPSQERRGSLAAFGDGNTMDEQASKRKRVG